MSRTLPDPLARRIGRELFVLPRGARLVDELECVLSVLLAILLAHLIGATNISWAAFSGYMVMRGHVSESLVRGLLRMIGTAAGAALALLIAPLVLPSIPAISIAAAIVGGGTLYGAITGKRAYAWLFVGLTFELILLDKLEHPQHALAAFAAMRPLDVAAGTAACILISTISTLTVRHRWPAEPSPPSRRIGWHPQALRHAAQAAIALAILPPLWSIFAVRELAQSSVTVMAAMIIPVTSLGVSGFAPVSGRLLLRIAGCVAGGALAAAALFAAHGTAAILIAATCLGVLIGRHIENGRSGIAYAGTQFTLAVLVTLVPDSYAGAEIGPALDRLLGALIGMAVLEPVLIAWHLIAPGRVTATTGPAADTLGE
jgi:uncharacterized membrane protein YccC